MTTNEKKTRHFETTESLMEQQIRFQKQEFNCRK